MHDTHRKLSLEGGRPVRNESRADLRHTVRERELERRRQELPDVWSADIVSLLNLNDTKNLPM